MSHEFASFDGFEVAVGNARNTANVSGALSTIGAGQYATAHIETHSSTPPHTPDIGQDSGLVLA